VIDGVCTTGALELALACDLRVAATTARLSDRHMSLSGLGIGAWGAAARLSRLVGVDKAKELLLLSSEVDGAEARRIGLVNTVVDSSELDATALGMASTIARMPRRGVRTTLAYLQLQADMDKYEAIRWADRMPDVAGLRLRSFGDAAERFFAGRRDGVEPV
jgi:enoyl-CoA hydratase/carnithine racemase